MDYETTYCPTCGKEGLHKWRGFVFHHTRMHPDEEEDRFWHRVNIGNEDECWEWQGSLDTGGYGNLDIDGWERTTHRQAWIFENGEIGDNWVLHTCDNRKCVNPNHLYLGDAYDNMRDRKERTGWHYVNNLPSAEELSGENGPGAKLTEEEVKEIKKLLGDFTQTEIAEKYGVDQTTISEIKLGNSWKGII